MEGTEGVTVMLCNIAEEVTTKVAEPLIVPEEAPIEVFPIESPEARPVDPIVAVDVLDDVQVTTFVMLEVVPPVKVPIAVNCC
jgi:hypothetical protein